MTDVVDKFVADVRIQVSLDGVREEALTAPARELVLAMASLVGEGRARITEKPSVVVGSERVGAPDMQVHVDGLSRFVVELKKPGKGADPTVYRGQHDRDQWTRYSLLPSVVYTDGNNWSLWRTGCRHGPVVTVCDDIADPTTSTGGDAADLLQALFVEAFSSEPSPITTPRAARQRHGTTL